MAKREVRTCYVVQIKPWQRHLYYIYCDYSSGFLQLKCVDLKVVRNVVWPTKPENPYCIPQQDIPRKGVIRTEWILAN